MYAGFDMLSREVKIENLGDVLAWYYGDQIVKEPFEIMTSPQARPEIFDEFNKFDKEVLQDLR